MTWLLPQARRNALLGLFQRRGYLRITPHIVHPSDINFPCLKILCALLVSLARCQRLKIQRVFNTTKKNSTASEEHVFSYQKPMKNEQCKIQRLSQKFRSHFASPTWIPRVVMRALENSTSPQPVLKNSKSCLTPPKRNKKGKKQVSTVFTFSFSACSVCAWAGMVAVLRFFSVFFRFGGVRQLLLFFNTACGLVEFSRAAIVRAHAQTLHGLQERTKTVKNHF